MKNCDWCQDHGLVTVFHRLAKPGEDVVTELSGRRVPERICAHCTCCKGKWMRDHTDKELLPRIPTFDEVLSGRLAYFFEQPDPNPELHSEADVPAFLAKWRGRDTANAKT